MNVTCPRQASCIGQLSPPAAVSALAAQWEWGVVCAGTAHGLAVFDALRVTHLLHKCTLNPHGLFLVTLYPA